MSGSLRRWLSLSALAVLVTLIALPGLGVRATYGAHTTADEPHYLLTAISLAEDGDLDVSDETAEERYRDFHEVDLPAQAAEQPDGSMVVPHDPLLPALLAGPWLLGGWPGAKAAVAVMLGLTAAVTAWTATVRFAAPIGWSVAGTGVLFASGPLAVYGTQVYPEVPAALVTITATAAVLGRPRPRNAVVVAVALVALPWLAVKYVPVAIAVTGVWAWRWWRAGATRLVTLTLLPLAFAGAAYVAAHLAWYGGLTVYAAGDFFQEHGGEHTVVGLRPDYLGRARRLVGLILGRDFGIAVWQPAWLLLPAGVAVALRSRLGDASVLVLPLAAGWLTATFVALTMQGWWHPGRQIVLVLPLAAVLVVLLGARIRWARLATGALGLLGVATLGRLWVDGLAEELTLIVDFARAADPLLQLRRAVAPDYLRVTSGTWILQAVWTAVMAAVTVLAWRSPGSATADRCPPAASPSRTPAPAIPVPDDRAGGRAGDGRAV